MAWLGRPADAGRDMNLLGYAGLIPNTVLPMFLGNAIKWFPTHLAAFNTFWAVGGSVGGVAWLIFGLMIHPSSERPGRSWQCTRHWAWDPDEDPWYQPARGERAAGPLWQPAEVAAAEADRLRRRHWAANLGGAALWAPRFRAREEERAAGGGPGAALCDRLLYGGAALARLGTGRAGAGVASMSVQAK
jgi:hypothetical protein